MCVQDADLQLAACFAPSEYTSVWVALDDVSPANGTLTLIPLHDTASGEAVEEDPDDSTHDPASAVTITLAAGGAVMFDSRVWHRSGPNASPAFRRVLYAQYAPGVVTVRGLARAGTGRPICFAVPCSHANESK